ncbi:hypothetical protein ACFL6Y_07000 [Elusimicrobiota bacterium]
MKFKIITFIAILHLGFELANLKVAFDYDDTLSFSSPAFEKVLGHKSVKPLSEKYWSMVNGNYKLEKPKYMTMAIALTAKLAGFDVVVISEREPYNCDDLVDSWNWLIDNFYFESEKSKILEKFHFVAFFGDSDADIAQANKAKIPAIRIRRSQRSVNKKNYNLGKYREWTLPFSG